MASNLDPNVGWNDLEDIREYWKPPLIVKGILHPKDALEAIRVGVDAIVVSNHGGRQLDGAIATLGALPAVAEAVNGKVPIFLDGGVRTGVDVIRALALGATACLVARPQLWALATDGQRGVERMLETYRSEMERAMALCGWRSLAEVDKADMRYSQAPGLW